MKTIFKLIVAFIFISLSSCDRDDPAPTPIIVEPAIFEYAEGGAPSRSTVTNPFANASTKKISGNNAAVNVVEMTLTSLAIGTYTISSSSGNSCKYTRPGQALVYTAITGTITILENDGSKISGSFDLTAGDSGLGINTVSGSFKRVIINP